MKRLILILILIGINSFFSFSQSKKDTVRVDTTQVEKIMKMPMDTIRDNMPLVPIPDSKDTTMFRTPKESKDTIMNRKSVDDADPKKKFPKQ